MSKRLLRSAGKQTVSDFYANREAELKAASIQKTKTKKALKATRAAQAARIAEAVEAAKSAATSQAASVPITAPTTSATTTTTTTEAEVQTEPIALKPDQKCPVCGRSGHTADTPDGDASTNPPTTQPPNSQSAAPDKSSWRKRDGTDHRINRDVIPRGVVKGRIGKRLPKGLSKRVKGLHNILAVSCYRNALLQCLLHTPAIYHLLGNIHQDCNLPADKCTTCVVQKIAQTYWSQNAANVASAQLDQLMEDFRQALKANVPQGTSSAEQLQAGYLIREEILNDQQNSSFDFAKGLIEIIKSQVATDSASCALLSQAFELKFRGTWTCRKCGKVHRDANETTEVGLEVDPFGLLPERKLHLEDYLDRTVFSENNPYVCEGEECIATKQAAEADGFSIEPELSTKHKRISQTPEVLMIRIRRSGPGIGADGLPDYRLPRVKLLDHIPFDEYLQLDDYSDNLEHSDEYKVIGVVYHAGAGTEEDGGHYVSAVRSRQRDEFVLCDDDVSAGRKRVKWDDVHFGFTYGRQYFVPYTVVYIKT